VTTDRLEAIARPTTYEVTCLPDDPYGGESWSIDVQFAGASRLGKPKPPDQWWAVRLRGHWCLSRARTWDVEPLPSERDEDWLAEHRFSLEDALERAKTMAPDIVVNGMTPAGLLASRGQRTAHAQSPE
jgi:hypothetical protein